MMNSLRKSSTVRQLGRSNPNSWKKRQTDSIVRSSSIFLDLPKREGPEQVERKSTRNAIPSSSVPTVANVSHRVTFLSSLLSPPPSSLHLALRSNELQSSNPFIGFFFSERIVLEDASEIPLIDLFQLNESRIDSSSTLSGSLRGGESHRKRRNQDRHQSYDIPNQSPWLQQFAQFSTSPSPPDSPPPSSSVPPSLSVAARTAAASRPAVPQQHKLAPTRIPTPPSGEPENPLESLKKQSPRSIVRKGVDMTISVFTTMLRFFFQLPGNLYYYLTHPTETRQKYAEMKQAVKDEVHHYWVGFKVRG